MVASRIRRAPVYLYIPVNAYLHMYVALRLYGGRGMWVRKAMLLTSDSTPLAFVAPNFRLYQIWSYAIRRLSWCWKCPTKARVDSESPSSTNGCSDTLTNFSHVFYIKEYRYFQYIYSDLLILNWPPGKHIVSRKNVWSNRFFILYIPKRIFRRILVVEV